MVIRYLTPEDAPLTVSNIYESGWKYAYRGIVPQSYLDSIPAGLWTAALHRPHLRHLVALEDGVPIGTAGFGPSRWEAYPDYGEVVSLYLLPAYIGQGRGGLLLGRCVEELKGQGFDKILLWVLEENRPARRFYERNGFVWSGVLRRDTVGGRELGEALYLLT